MRRRALLPRCRGHGAIARTIGLVVGMADGAVDLRKAGFDQCGLRPDRWLAYTTGRSALRYDDYGFWRAAEGVTIAWTC
jgi:hypothetical protein